MRRFWKFVSAYLLVAALALSFVPGSISKALAQAGVTVEAIEFQGNRRYDEATIRTRIRTKVGQTLDRALLQEDVNTLYTFFDTVEIEESQTASGVRLLFRVTENAMVKERLFVGVERLSTSEIEAVIDTRASRPLADFRLENDVARIARLYRDEGFHFVEVSSEVRDEGDTKVVTFFVREGPRVSVDEILFEGASQVAESELSKNMATQASGFLGLGGSDFVEETLRLDLLTLRNYYRSEGWLDASVDLTDLEFSEDRSDVIVRISVTEGAPYTVSDVQIVGAENYPAGDYATGVDALRELVRTPIGGRRRQAEISDTISALERAYREEGYFAVRVVADESLPTSGHGVAMTFTIEEQAKVRVRNLDILGNTITQDKVLRREISIFPGGVLNQNEIDKSLNRLKSLRYFNRVTANVREIPEGADPDQRDVVFEIEDGARTGQLRFAAGASSDLGFIGSISLTKRNFDWKDLPERFSDVFNGRAFTGAGQTFSLELSPGSEFSSYRLAFTEPWVFDRPISFGWDLFYSKFSRFDYDANRQGVNLSLGRRWTLPGKKLDTVVGLTGTTRIESQGVDNIADSAAPSAFLSEDDLSLVAERLSLRIDRVDNSADPTTGWFTDLSTEFGFAGDVRLWKNAIEAKRFWVLHKDDEERDHVFSISANFAYAQALGSSQEADPNLFDEQFVPVYERYRAGGSSSVRGFRYGGAGPHGEGDPRFAARSPGERVNARLARTAYSILENDGDPLGGNVQLTASAEYTYPLYEELLRGVVFIDAGMVRDDFDSSHGLERDDFDALVSGLKNRRLARRLHYDEGPSFFSDVRVAVGFGVRIRLPVFGQQPIALDFGFPIRDRDGDDRQVLSFSIARDF